MSEANPSSVTAAFRAGRRRQLLTLFVVAVCVGLLPLAVKDVYLQNMMVLTLMYAALSQSWNILGGYCGQISLGHALYFGIGAYASTLLFTKAGISPWFGALAGGSLAGAVALVLGYMVFRLKGHYFTIATIVLAEAALTLLLSWPFAGGALGIQVPPGPDNWANLQFGRDKLPYIYTALSLAVIVFLVTWKIEDSRWGYWWRAVKDNSEAAESLGVVIFRSKMAAAALSAFFVAVGGSFYAQFVAYIDPESVMNFHFSLLFALPAVLGGIGTLWGPALGAVILIPLTEITRSYLGGSGQGIDLILYGVMVMGIALLKPEGLIDFFVRRPASIATVPVLAAAEGVDAGKAA